MHFETAVAVQAKCEKKKILNWDAPTVFMPLIVVAQRQTAYIAFVEISQGYKLLFAKCETKVQYFGIPATNSNSQPHEDGKPGEVE